MRGISLNFCESYANQQLDATITVVVSTPNPNSKGFQAFCMRNTMLFSEGGLTPKEVHNKVGFM